MILIVFAMKQWNKKKIWVNENRNTCIFNQHTSYLFSDQHFLVYWRGRGRLLMFFQSYFKTDIDDVVFELFHISFLHFVKLKKWDLNILFTCPCTVGRWFEFLSHDRLWRYILYSLWHIVRISVPVVIQHVGFWLIQLTKYTIILGQGTWL